MDIVEKARNLIANEPVYDTPTIKSLIFEIERLREENEYLKAQGISDQYKAEFEGYRMGYADGHSDGAESESEAFRRGYGEGLADARGSE